MINWFDMPAEGLSNGGLFEVKELEVTENGTYETKGEMYNKVTVNVEGGGSSWQIVFEGSVTTSGSETAEGTINYSEQISADTIKVTFNGTEYECPKINTPFGGVAYGGIGEQGYDFTEYPFVIMSGEGTEQTIVNTLVTQTAGTYTLKIEEPQSGGSSDFSTAEVTIHFTFSEFDLEGASAGFPIAIIDNAISTVGRIPMSAIPSGSTSADVIVYMPLYKNKLEVDMSYSSFGNSYGTLIPSYDGTPTASGNASFDGWVATITGDCTLTLPMEVMM